MICKTKQWGNSLGIIIPKELVNELNLKPNEEVHIEVSKKGTNVLKEMFGAMKFKKPTEEILKEIRKNESKFI